MEPRTRDHKERDRACARATALEWPLLLWNLGLSIYPVPLPDPRRGWNGRNSWFRWTRLQRERLTLAEIEALFARPCNIAIVTGSRWGLAVVDADDDVAVSWLRRYLPRSPWTWRSGDGLKAAYRIERPTRTGTRIFGPDGIALDVQADGGSTIGPGSVHESGVRYEPEPGSDWTAPLAKLPLLPELVARRLVYPPPRLVVPVAAAFATTDPMRRGVRYLAKCPPPSKGEMKTQTFKVACKLVGMIGLDVEEAVALLVPWSGLRERDVRHQVRGAARRHREAVVK